MARHTNTAHVLPAGSMPASRPAVRPVIREHRKAKPIVSVKQLFVSVLIVAYVVGICGALVFFKAQLAQQNAALLTAQNELQEIQKENTRLNLDAEQTLSLKKIEEIATAEFGMVKANESNTSYIQVEKPDRIQIYPARTDLAHKLFGFLDSIKEYFPQ